MTIVSNFFNFKEENAKIDLDNIMATSNKEYIRIPESIRKEIAIKPKALLLGDLIEDIKMINKEKLKETITFGFLDIQIQENIKNIKKILMWY